MNNRIEKLSNMINESADIVFFGGAGVSTESGIPDFRSPDGLYNQAYKYPPETMLSHEFFMEHTQAFYEFYRDRVIYKSARPNKAHETLAGLERAGKLSAVVTQNIDGLHQLCGSKNVLELHGSVYRNYCVECGTRYDLDFIMRGQGVPLCECGGIIKPDVVLYGEALDGTVVSRALEHIMHAEMLIIGGTSLAVYPAAGLVNYFKGRHLVLINKSATPLDNKADLVINERIGEALCAACESMF